MNENHRRHLAKDFRYIVCLIGICSLIGFLESFVPLLDLFNHFRLQAIAGSIFCLVCSAFLKDKLAVMIACAVLALNAGIVGYKIVLTSGIPALEDASQATFSIVSSNVLTSNDDYQAVIDMAVKESPDLLVFSEVNQSWAKKLSVLGKTYPYKVTFPRPDNFGLAAFSKKPFERKVRYAGDARLPILILELDGLTVIGAHPLPPSSIRNMPENRIYLSEVANIASGMEGPVIVAGDLNATLWSAALRPLIDAELKRINPWGIAHTWRVGNWLYALQIDHFFGKGIKAADFKVLPAVGSDHYPIRADIRWEEDALQEKAP